MKMKIKRAGPFVALMAVVLAAAFSAGRVYAGGGGGSCFNDTAGHWAETFICWMSSNGITNGYPDGGYHPNATVSRAEMAVFMARQAEIPPSTGDIYVSVGPANWVANSSNNGYVDYFSAVNHLRSTSTGNQIFLVQPILPVGLYNRQMYLKGVKVCYQAGVNASISDVNLIQQTGAAFPTLYAQVDDNTVRTDTTCREYDFSAPSPLQGTDLVTLTVTVNFANTGSWVNMVNTVFILTPSASAGVLGAPTADGSPSFDVPSSESGLNP
jgi:hypothetical protein